ncbi:hypothetical protein [Leucobacter aridicollis]|uniref:Uncharacterized protein n=1 Tax=Leucobacter aridicollis TaxID=283878 RepID=A0A852QZZ5_9MICO|nr:hypothetical protein [Leucobacter aridicollis]MBL3682012.1 hypothetical protein [Leucobacter aridicollis]NYD26941.1 hypothetical protein [Leucobacter aridicollis]
MSTVTRHDCHPDYEVYDTESEAEASIVEALSEQADGPDFGADFDADDLDEHDLTLYDVVSTAWDLPSLYADAIVELECDCLDEGDEESVRGEEHGTFYGIFSDLFHETESRHFSHVPTLEELI